MPIGRFARCIVPVVLLLAVVMAPGTDRTAAQRPDAPRYGQTGAYAVGTLETVIPDEDRPLTATVWYPADATPGEEPVISYNLGLTFNVEGNAYRDSDPLSSDAPYPLVIFSHSSGGSRVLSLFLTEHLASHGFVVIAADHPGNNVYQTAFGEQDFVSNYAYRPNDIHRQIDYAADVLNAPGGALEGIIDTDNVAVTGHSFGGLAALLSAGGRLDFSQLEGFCDITENIDLRRNVCFLVNFQNEIAAARNYDAPASGAWESVRDPRIDAAVAYAPWNGPVLNLDDQTSPTLIIVGTSDQTAIPERDAYAIYNRLTAAPRYLLEMTYAGHTIFIDTCSSVLLQFDLFEACSDAVWDMQRAHDIINHTTTAFLLTHLNDDRQAATHLSEDRMQFRATGFTRDMPSQDSASHPNRDWLTPLLYQFDLDMDDR
jgi:predicted dienelactone hydrolase